MNETARSGWARWNPQHWPILSFAMLLAALGTTANAVMLFWEVWTRATAGQSIPDAWPIMFFDWFVCGGLWIGWASSLYICEACAVTRQQSETVDKLIEISKGLQVREAALQAILRQTFVELNSIKQPLEMFSAQIKLLNSENPK